MPEFTDFNQEQYEKNAEAYIESNANGGIGGNNRQERVALVSAHLTTGRSVLEIGSGEGLDALALQAAGYEVTASDYVQAFVNTLKDKNLSAIHFDAKNNELPSNYACIYANAVFVHFSPEELTSFLIKAKDHLTDEKIVFLSVIKGNGSERSGRNRGFDRDFTYYQLADIEALAKQSGYKVVLAKDVNDKWLQVIFKVV